MYYPYVHQRPKQDRRVMTVTGIGNQSIAPDTANIQLEVRIESVELTQAQRENAYVMNQVIESLLNLGISAENIKTVSYTVFPQYDYVEGKQVFRGYEVTNAVSVKVPSIEQVGKVIDVAVQNGANSVSNIQFTVNNEKLHYEKALSLALENAVSKAQAIANTMQLQLDPTPTTITEAHREEPNGSRPFMAKEMAASTPIEPGQIEITATVKVQFQY